ncbi:hypothetical protein [Yoonia algicola]|uniref:PRC-barrel domain-containing protein n=1 Tax=Yoonia algicola TaxID=3137368 RepID=A0AAN0M1J5_9RHOB
MNASTLIGRKMTHATDTEIVGEVTDILFDRSLKAPAFVLASITTARGTAPVLFSPAVLALDDEAIRISAHPDDIAARVDATIDATNVAVAPGDLPSTFIGPFGNAFSPSMIAALFNARTASERPDPPTDGDGVWFSELLGTPVRAHVSDIGHVSDMIFDDHFTVCEGVEIKTYEQQATIALTKDLQVKRTPDGTLLLAFI